MDLLGVRRWTHHGINPSPHLSSATFAVIFSVKVIFGATDCQWQGPLTEPADKEWKVFIIFSLDTELDTWQVTGLSDERVRKQTEEQQREVTIHLNGISIHLQPDGMLWHLLLLQSHTTSHHTTEDLAVETKPSATLASVLTPYVQLKGKKSNPCPFGFLLVTLERQNQVIQKLCFPPVDVTKSLAH